MPDEPTPWTVAGHVIELGVEGWIVHCDHCNGQTLDNHRQAMEWAMADTHEAPDA